MKRLGLLCLVAATAVNGACGDDDGVRRTVDGADATAGDGASDSRDASEIGGADDAASDTPEDSLAEASPEDTSVSGADGDADDDAAPGDADDAAPGDADDAAPGDADDASEDATQDGGDASTEPDPAWQRDLLLTDLTLDLTLLEGTALVTLASDDLGRASLRVGPLLDVSDVRGPDDQALAFTVTDDRLDVDVPDDGTDLTITVRYSFAAAHDWDGYLRGSGVSFTWPYFCGNLFPCNPAPSEGLRFRLTLLGVPEGDVAVYPESIDFDAPPYMLGFAVGPYLYQELGRTGAGTEVGVWYLEGHEERASEGTAGLAEMFDWLERTLGRYPFGRRVASVEADWGLGAYGGMEHHPYWHVASGAMRDVVTHVHEAAHGWFGNGVRIACWEDFALSEGLATYLAARAIEAVGGRDAGTAVWDEYRAALEDAVDSGDTAAWPGACGAIDILVDPLWSDIPYMKGAFFMRAVEAEVGRVALDEALAGFVADHLGDATGMGELIAHLEAATGAELDPLVDDWLTGLGIP